jgi:hypothetical protein
LDAILELTAVIPFKGTMEEDTANRQAFGTYCRMLDSFDNVRRGRLSQSNLTNPLVDFDYDEPDIADGDDSAPIPAGQANPMHPTKRTIADDEERWHSSSQTEGRCLSSPMDHP